MDFGLPFLDIWTLLRHLLSMLAAYALAMPLAWEREQKDGTAGLRTFPLVALTACAFLLLGQRIFPESSAAQGRLVAGLITGIGFIGGGAILKGDGKVQGTATATAIWSTGGIGAAVAYDAYDIALLLTGLGYVTFRLMRRVKKEAGTIPSEDQESEDQEEGASAGS